MHGQHRARLDEHAHRRGAGHHQPAARCCCCPSDTLRHPRSAHPFCRSSSSPHDDDVTVNDAFKPLSRFFDRIWRPEQLPSALLGAMRVLTDPVETGAVTARAAAGRSGRGVRLAGIAVRRTDLARRRPAARALGDRRRGRRVIRSARRPLIVAGGGVIYSGANDALAAFAEQTGIPVGRDAGRQGLAALRPSAVASARSARPAPPPPTRWPPRPTSCIGIGTRYSDFTTASRTAFNDPDVRFVNINVASLRRGQAGRPRRVVADAREALEALAGALGDYAVGDEYRTRTAELRARMGRRQCRAAYRRRGRRQR